MEHDEIDLWRSFTWNLLFWNEGFILKDPSSQIIGFCVPSSIVSMACGG